MDLMLVLLAAYLLPMFIAFGRDHPNAWPITILDLLLGWTFIGWVVALIWSLTSFERKEKAGRELSELDF